MQWHPGVRRTMEKKKKIVVAGLVGLTCASLAGGYCGIAAYYNTRFFPGTKINGMDFGRQELPAVGTTMRLQSSTYELEVFGRDLKSCESDELLLTITAGDIGLADVGVDEALHELLGQQNEWLWIQTLTGREYAYDMEQEVSFDEEKLKSILRECDWFQRKNMTEPQNAYIGGYSDEDKGFVIVADTRGSRLNTDKAREAIEEAILHKEASVDLEEQGCYRTARVLADDEKLLDNLNEANLWLSTEITYDWNGNEVMLNREQLKDWVSIVKDRPVLDKDAVAAFVKENAKEYDTYGKKRKFVTTMGTEVSLNSGAYGWRTDRSAETEELTQMIYQGSVLQKEPIYSMRAAQKGSNDIGNSYVEADLTHQHLYLYSNGKIVVESDFVSGNVSNGNTTPPGVFGLTYKTMDAVLRGDNYETPVKYWMPFNGNIGMHDATWRSSFGGDIYLTSGSHGCINLPYNKAKEIYQYVSTGFPVICYY